MDTIKHSRFWPSVILIACAVGVVAGLRASGSVVAAAGARTVRGDPMALKVQLEQTIGRGHADAAVWRQYSECLMRLGDPAGAAAAYAKILELDPMNRDVRYLRAVALASAGEAEPFYDVVSDLSLDDPRLTCEVLDRPESRHYLAASRFRRLRDEARAHAID